MLPTYLLTLRGFLRLMLAGGAALLVAVFLALIAVRLFEQHRARRKCRLEKRYRAAADALVDPERAPDALHHLSRCPRRHRDVIGHLLLARLRVTSGDAVEALRHAAAAIRLDVRWRRALGSRRWWERAEAAMALGLIRQAGAGGEILRLLDDRHEQVRAAAVTAAGWLADPEAIAPLLAQLANETRHQRVRIIEALQHFGAEAAGPLLAYATQHDDLVPLIADVLGQLRLTSASDRLVEWTSHVNPDVRAAAFRALGATGLDDRSFYYAVRGLGDECADVRAMAARALGRAQRVDAVSYLETCLHDGEWAVAAEGASALRVLGVSGRAALERARDRAGLAGELARQMLWDSRPAGEKAAA